MRVILATSARIDSRKPLPKDNYFDLLADDYCGLYDVDPKNGYRQLEDAANRLYEREIRRINGQRKKRMRWVYSAEYFPGEGRIRLGFSPEIIPYLTMLHNQLTKYPLKDVAGLQSPYHYRLYEMLMQFSKTKFLVVKLDEFRDTLQLEDKYPRFANLKARVIAPAVAEINAKTPIEVTWKPIRKNRAVVRLEFRYDEKSQMSLL
jgi:plasmid replication initiation protein